jgi:hypothetical protein
VAEEAKEESVDEVDSLHLALTAQVARCEVQMAQVSGSNHHHEAVSPSDPAFTFPSVPSVMTGLGSLRSLGLLGRRRA